MRGFLQLSRATTAELLEHLKMFFRRYNDDDFSIDKAFAKVQNNDSNLSRCRECGKLPDGDALCQLRDSLEISSFLGALKKSKFLL